jgi:uncharacterized protein (DUF433 family)
MQATRDPACGFAEVSAARWPRLLTISRRHGNIAHGAPSMSDLLARITINPDILHGRPCIRGLRISVADVLGQFAAGASRQDILRDYPYLEDADIDAVLAFAARKFDPPIILVE